MRDIIISEFLAHICHKGALKQRDLGEFFSLIEMNNASGRHAKIKCKNCHRPKPSKLSSRKRYHRS